MWTQKNKKIVVASFRLIETGDVRLARQIIAPEFVNREAEDDPEQADRSLRGPEGFLATGVWLRKAFADLQFEILDVIGEGGKVVVRAVMTGRHTGEFQNIPPTGRTFRQRQIHCFRIRSGKIEEHLAQRDDLGLLLHLGWRADSAMREEVS